MIILTIYIFECAILPFNFLGNLILKREASCFLAAHELQLLLENLIGSCAFGAGPIFF